VSDSQERLRALDPAKSFLVQAPAGSGKTALLTQRFLRLLSVVDEPEQILAITFTRKAAAEMRVRVLRQLRRGQGAPPESEFERQGWELAQAALHRDRERHWGILDSPRRLRVQTIDGFQSALVKRLPWLSRWGVGEGVTENAPPIYADAVREALRALAEHPGDDGENLRALIDLLKLRDNKLERLSQLLVHLVGHRDEWISALGTSAFLQGNLDALRHQLERNIQLVVEDELRKLRAAAPHDLGRSIASLARFAAENLTGTDPEIVALSEIEDWPEANAAALPVWRGLRKLLLTGEGEVRKSVNKNQGFPSAFKAEKQRMVEVLEQLREEELLVASLKRVGILPDVAYTKSQWRILQALFRLMRVLIPSLQLQFAERHESDFLEIAIRAAGALEEAPGVASVLAERLDAQLQHILVDEFQDTSVLQMQLIRKLTENWVPGDGRSLFLVGDPMQSIYGWRNARVDLFLRAWHGELSGLPPLETVQLRRNFRSRPRLIEECNILFRTLFPKKNDPSSGSVVHAAADAGQTSPDTSACRIHYHAFLAKSPKEEAEWVADEIVRLRNEAREKGEPTPSIGVLYRKGASAIHVAQALLSRGERYQAVDVESLGDLPVITDLKSILKALLSSSNCLAWWSVLRAPWNGLSLQELERLHLLKPNGSVWEAIRLACAGEDQGFHPQSLRRLQRTREAFSHAIEWRGRVPLTHLVRALFLNTGASRCHADARSQSAADEFFRLLMGIDESELLGNPSLLDAELNRMKAPVDPEADGSIQLLTIHKSKGLEFDVVFVPCLNESPPAGQGFALSWDEVVLDDESDSHRAEVLLMVPGKATSDAPSLLGKYLAVRRTAREEQERLRVLYVAFTRARETLHALATISPEGVDSADALRPKRGSYLQTLWSCFEQPFREEFERRAAGSLLSEEDFTTMDASPYPPLVRLKPESLPAMVQPHGLTAKTAGETQFYRPGGTWETLESASGTVFHRVMELASDGRLLSHIQRAGVSSLRPVVLDALRALLPAELKLETAVDRILYAVERTAHSHIGQWIFSSSHREVLAEQSISYAEGNMRRELRLDRVFRDEQGRWHIVDFKLVGGDLADKAGFLEEQRRRYEAQLERYARLFQQTYPEPVTLTLYFPLQDEQIQWTLSPLAQSA
jgi:ATP-dependent helicase/nuclease subunit A